MNTTTTSARSSRTEARIAAYSRIQHAWPRLHLAKYVHLNAKGKRLRFDNRAWLVDIYKDDSDRMVIPKSTKTGVSEMMMVDIPHQAKKGFSGMYILPDQPIRDRFVSSRLDPIFGKVPEYRNAIGRGISKTDDKGVNKASLKTIFGRTWAFVGGKNPDTFYEFDADMLIFDERDKIPALSIKLAEDRIGAATQERYKRVGNPTIKGYGIDKDFQGTDQKYWHVKCHRCNEWQVLTWLDQFVETIGSSSYRLRDPEYQDADQSTIARVGGLDARAMCKKCCRPFDRLGFGEWVAKEPDKFAFASGYHVTRFFGVPGNDNGGPPRPIILEEYRGFMEAQTNPTLTQLWWNNRAGVPYEADGSKITESVLMRAILDGYKMPHGAGKDEGAVCFGMDVGKVLNIKIDRIVNGKRRAIFIGTCPLDLDAVCNLLEPYNAMRGVVDAAPETLFVKNLQARMPMLYRCYYGLTDDRGLTMNVDHKERKITVGRTESLDYSLKEWMDDECELPIDQASIDNGEWVKQMLAPTRILDENKTPPRYVWDEGAQADHYRHGDNYSSIAGRMLGQTPTITFI